MSLRNVTLEAHEVLMDSIRNLLRTSAAMYMYVTEETIARFGFAGERAIRRHLRAYGKWRGSEMRQAHLALGFPINIETIRNNWDSASAYLVQGEAGVKCSPYKSVEKVVDCPAATVWKSREFWHWGHMYCDEFHEACASSYHPDVHVVVPENLMKGDPACKFFWSMSPQTEKLAFGPETKLGKKLSRDYLPTSPSDAAGKALKRGIRIHGGRYATLAQELTKAFGIEGEEVLRRGLNRWAFYRGRVLRNQHDSLSITPIPSSLFTNFDLPYQFLWDAMEIMKSSSYALEIKKCPLVEVWQDVRLGDLGYIYCIETYAALCQGYGLRGDFELTHCQGCGDDRCILEIGTARIEEST